MSKHNLGVRLECNEKLHLTLYMLCPQYKTSDVIFWLPIVNELKEAFFVDI